MNASIMLLFYGAIFAVIYFFFIRPQSQKIKEGKKFIDEVQKGSAKPGSTSTALLYDSMALSF